MQASGAEVDQDIYGQTVALSVQACMTKYKSIPLTVLEMHDDICFWYFTYIMNQTLCQYMRAWYTLLFCYTSWHYDTLLITIEGRLDGKRGRRRTRRTWVDDLRYTSKRYDQMKIAAERKCVHGTFATHSSGFNNNWMPSHYCVPNKLIFFILVSTSVCR